MAIILKTGDPRGIRGVKNRGGGQPIPKDPGLLNLDLGRSPPLLKGGHRGGGSGRKKDEKRTERLSHQSKDHSVTEYTVRPA